MGDESMDARSLYEQLILEHNRHPRNFGHHPSPMSHDADGHNPLCGDKIRVELHVDADGVIRDVGFHGDSCAISTASASLMTDAITGLSMKDAETLFADVRAALTADASTDLTQQQRQRLGELTALLGVRDFPMRVKCATLPWHTLHAALSSDKRSVTTE